MAAGHLADRHARLQRLSDDLEFVLEAPAPPALCAENFDLHRSADLKASLKVRTSRANSALTRGRTPSAYPSGNLQGPDPIHSSAHPLDCSGPGLIRGSTRSTS